MKQMFVPNDRFSHEHKFLMLNEFGEPYHFAQLKSNEGNVVLVDRFSHAHKHLLLNEFGQP
jgi:hypothetical protein